jgi:hypothetical protein
MRDILDLLKEAAGQSYRERLEAQGYRVTADEYEDHKGLLESLLPMVKDMQETNNDLYRLGFLTNEQSETLQAAVKVYKDLMVPMTLLSVAEKPKAAPKLPPKP